MRDILNKIYHRLPALRRAAELVYKSSAKWTVVSTVLTVVQGLFPLLTIYLMKLIVDAVTSGLAAADSDAAFRRVFSLIVLAGAVAAAGFLISALGQVVQEYRDLRVAEYIHELIHRKSVQVDLEFYENPSYFNTLYLAQHQALYRPVQMVNKLAQVVQNGITLGAMVAVLMTFDVLLIIFVGVAVIPAVWAKFKFSKRVYRWYQQWANAERKAQYYSWLITSQQYAKDLRLYQLGELFISRFRGLHWQVVMDRLKLNRKRATADFMGQVFTVVLAFALLAIMAKRAVLGMITIGGLVMYYQAFQRGQTALQTSLKGMADLYEDSLFLQSLFEFLHLQPEIVDPPQPLKLPRKLKKGIEFAGVSFRYPESARMALQDVTFVIQPGEHVALVGENGSGKSTLVKLLCRLYDPLQGSIRVDDIDLCDLKVEEWRASLSVLFQDFSQYHASARENIWLGNIQLEENDRRIIEAAKLSGAHELVTRLPSGYDTPLGKWFEDGEELSVGEWQKVAIARAFLRDAQIVVLDEPTSALDAKAEFKIFQLFKSLAENKTAIFISHRLSSARIADRILVLDRGRLVEEGSHGQLMRRRGLYAQLFTMQAKYYR